MTKLFWILFQDWWPQLRTRDNVDLALLLLLQVRLLLIFWIIGITLFCFPNKGLFETCMIKAGAKKSGNDLSEQYLVDCAYGKYGANGCNGANPYAYAKWLPEQGGQMPHETSYPYLGSSPKLNCNSAPTTMWNSGAKVTKGTVDWTCGASKLKSLIHSNGAVAVGVYASDNSFGTYKSGIYNGCTR